VPSLRKLLGDRRSRSRFDRALVVTLVTGLGLLLVLGLVFSAAYGSRQITTKAGGLHDADETLRAATVVRAQVGLAVHMASVDRILGTFSDEAIGLSVTEAEVALADMATGLTRLVTAGVISGQQTKEAIDYLGSTAEEIILAIESGRVDDALRMAEPLDATFTLLVGELETVRDELAASVAASDALLSRIGDVARFLVAFLAPAAIIFIYRELLLRQQRQRDLENRLDWERQLSRAREDFIANASHELRTPLTGISGLAMLLAEDPDMKASESASELLDLIISESADLARMVEDLLTTARLDAGALHFNFEDLDVSQALEEVVKPLTRSGVDIDVSCETANVTADRLRLHQVVRNLLSNARKYGGTHVAVVGKVEGRTYAVSVVDDGPGIPEDVERKLFQRFVHQEQAPALNESVGLGLSIVNALVQGMGGSVTHNRRDDRTWFTVRLPLAGAAKEPVSALDSSGLEIAEEPSFGFSGRR
jgi:signal transduction histidine kinase